MIAADASGWGVMAAAALLSYLCGSIPFGLLFTRLSGYGDIRAIGSGNIGATNVLRTGNKKLAAATLLCDAAKGAVPVAIAWRFGADVATVAAIAATLGHIFPLWLGFKGGKGVATACGVLFAYAWPLAVAAIATWIITALVFRYSSLAAVAAAIAVPIYAFLFPRAGLSPWVISLIALIVLIRHRSNVMRLVHGQEDKIRLRKGHA
jgi:acyl phosphate:glycerol-3-phosphate acyltransferase